MNSNSVIIKARRTPIGSFQGDLSSFSASELASFVIQDILNDTRLDRNKINEIILGNVLSAGQGQAPARQAALKGGCVNSIEALTINKMCGSGLKAVMLADQAIRCGDAEIILAGGMESMSNSPHLLMNSREGTRLGHSKVVDSLIHDGLWDAYTKQHMGSCAELLVSKRNYSRQDQDNFAIQSYSKARDANEGNLFENEIVPIPFIDRMGDEKLIEKDEEPFKLKLEKIPQLKPAFKKEGTITAANASKLNDGAAVLLITDEHKAEKLGIKPLAKIIAHASVAHEPEWFTSAPGKAITKVLAKANLLSENIDLWEINEAFSAVTMAVMEDFKISSEKINIYGGAVALGHPIGASGARILTTLLNGMKNKRVINGLATLCIGGGEASAIIVENYD
ncbi:MAG: acetyl-CoA acetyltransferase [bacterium TMED264]|nr:MAG: acetyl-CoA acetyltransferase [bacterium TMED264]|tara:strand:- start:579 stop:1763 length:1185 start_codon:yes stop_codon:yes gene_type:complete